MRLQIVLWNRPEAIAAEPSPGQRRGIIVFGSDQGMCGSFNEQVATFALEQINALPEKEEDRMVLVVGARVVGRLEDAGCSVGARFPVPSTVSGRSEERRVGKECVSTCSAGGSPYH